MAATIEQVDRKKKILMKNLGLEAHREYTNSYSLLKVAVVKIEQGRNVVLVKLRNPSSKLKWTGAWGDNSDELTPKIKQKLEYEPKDDGIFWMEYN